PVVLVRAKVEAAHAEARGAFQASAVQAGADEIQVTVGGALVRVHADTEIEGLDGSPLDFGSLPAALQASAEGHAEAAGLLQKDRSIGSHRFRLLPQENVHLHQPKEG